MENQNYGRLPTHDTANYDGPKTLTTGKYTLTIEYDIQSESDLPFISWVMPRDTVQNMIYNEVRDKVLESMATFGEYDNMTAIDYKIEYTTISFNDMMHDLFNSNKSIKVPSSIKINFEVKDNPILAYLVVAAVVVILMGILPAPKRSIIDSIGSSLGSVTEGFSKPFVYVGLAVAGFFGYMILKKA